MRILGELFLEQRGCLLRISGEDVETRERVARAQAVLAATVERHDLGVDRARLVGFALCLVEPGQREAQVVVARLDLDEAEQLALRGGGIADVREQLHEHELDRRVVGQVRDGLAQHTLRRLEVARLRVERREPRAMLRLLRVERDDLPA